MVTTKHKCFYCGESDHMVKDCHWKSMPCFAVGCDGKMLLLFSKVEKSYGCRFLRCKNQPMCSAFKWVDEPTYQGTSVSYENRGESTSQVKSVGAECRGASTSQVKSVGAECSSNVKVVREQNGVKLTFEGNVDSVVELMKKTHMY